MNHTAAIVRRHWMPLLGLNSVLLAATIFSVTYLADQIFSPVWMAKAKLTIPVKDGNLNSNLGTLGNLKDSSQILSSKVNPLQTQSEILTSDAVMDRVLEADPQRSLYSTIKSYRQLFEVTLNDDQSAVIALEAGGSSPELALRRMQNLLEFYQQRLDELRRRDADAREKFAQDELERARQNLIQAQNELANFQQSTGLINSRAQTQSLIESINQLKTQKTQIMAEAEGREIQAKMAAAYLGTTPEQAMNSLRLAENKEYQALREKLSQVEIALAETRSQYTDESPQVQSLLMKHQELSRKLNEQIAAAIPGINAKSVDTTLGGNGSDSRIGIITELIGSQTTAKGLEQQAAQLQAQVDKFSAELNSIAQNQAQLSELQRKYNVAEGVYKGIIAQVNQAKINTFNSHPNVQLIDGPTLDPEPLKPNRNLLALGGILASIFGSIGLVSFLESRDPLLSPKDLQKVEFPLVLSISRLKLPELGWELEANAEREFQRLASVFSSLVLENHRLMVTSATFGEGKTTVALGLAMALIKLGFRVLVVDGDLHQAQMSRRLGHSRTDIEGSSQQHLIPVYPGLDLMPAPIMSKDKIGEFFARGSFERRLSSVQKSGGYDYVLVDSAPVSLASETALMSTVVDNVLFVVRPGTSDRYSVMDSFEQLAQHHAQIKGLVVNGVESRTEVYRYGRKRELLEAEL